MRTLEERPPPLLTRQGEEGVPHWHVGEDETMTAAMNMEVPGPVTPCNLTARIKRSKDTKATGAVAQATRATAPACGELLRRPGYIDVTVICL